MTGFIKFLSGSSILIVATIKVDSLPLPLIPSLPTSHALLFCKKMFISSQGRVFVSIYAIHSGWNTSPRLLALLSVGRGCSRDDKCCIPPIAEPHTEVTAGLCSEDQGRSGRPGARWEEPTNFLMAFLC